MSNPNFETKLNQLEALVNKLEQKTLPLDTAVTTFKQGVELVSECQKILNQAEQTIAQLTKENKLEPLNLAPTDADHS